jgi:hypothetical protein
VHGGRLKRARCVAIPTCGHFNDDLEICAQFLFDGADLHGRRAAERRVWRLGLGVKHIRERHEGLAASRASNAGPFRGPFANFEIQKESFNVNSNSFEFAKVRKGQFLPPIPPVAEQGGGRTNRHRARAVGQGRSARSGLLGAL